MTRWVETKSWFEGLALWRKLGTVLVLLFPAVALGAWALEDPSLLRVAVAIGGYAAIVVFYVWQEVRVLSKLRGQPRPSIAEFWSDGNAAQRIRLVVIVAVAIALIVIGAFSGFNERMSKL